MQRGQRVAVNTALMIAKQVIMAVLGVVFIGYMARMVGVAAWGELQASFATVAVVGLVAGVGVRAYLAREIAVDPALGPRHLGSALAIRGFTCAVMLVVTVAAGVWLLPSLGAVLLALAAVSQLAAMLYSTMWLSFEAHERLQYIVYVELGARLFVIGLGMSLLALGLGVVAAAAVFTLGNVLELGLTYHFVRTRLYRPRLEASVAELWRIVVRSLPYGLVSAQLAALQQSDTVLLRWLDGERSVGIFSAARVVSENFHLIPDAFMAACFAAGMRTYALDREAFGRLYRTAMIAALALGLPIAVGGFLLAPEVIGLVYGGGQYASSARVLRVLICSVPIGFALQVAALPLVAAKRERVVAWILAAALAANVISNVVLVPRYHAVGAAFSTLATSGLTLLAVVAATAGTVRLIPVARVARLAAATALMGVAAHAANRAAGMWCGIGVAVPLYATLLFVLGGVTREEIVALVRGRLAERDGGRRDERAGAVERAT